MKTTILISLFAFYSSLCISQVISKEVLKDGDNEKQMTLSETAMYEGSKSVEAKKYFDDAMKFESEKDFKNAIKYYLKSIKADPEFVEAYDNLGLVYRRTDDVGNAIKYYKKSIELYPDGVMAHQNLAVAYDVIKDNDNAMLQFKEIIRIAPKDPEGYFGLANTLMTLSRFDEALTNGMKALELYEESNSHHLGDGYQIVGLIYYFKGDKNKALLNFQLAKQNGATLHPKIEEEFFGGKTQNSADPREIALKSFSWLMETPLGQKTEDRKKLSGYLVQYLSETKDVSVEVIEALAPFGDCSDCLIIYLGGWMKYVLESKDKKNKYKAASSAIESVLKFYTKNKSFIGVNAGIEGLISKKEDNTLDEFIRSNIK